MKKISSGIVVSLFFIISVFIYAEENHIGFSILLRSSISETDNGLGINVFYNRNINETISVKAYFQGSFSSDKYLRGLTSYGMDLNYTLINTLYIGTGINYNFFTDDQKGNTETTIPFLVSKFHYENALGLNLLFGANIPLSTVFSLIFETKYNFLRPTHVNEIVKLDNTKEIRTSRQILDNIHFSLGIFLNF